MHFKKIEHDLGEAYPEMYRSQYSLVSFSTSPYSYALAQGYKNEALIQYIMEHKLEDKIPDASVMMPLFRDFLGEITV
jgi:hypothetical protein